MKNVIFAIMLAMVLASCENPVQIVPEPIPMDEYYANDPRLTAVGGAEDARWIAYPRQSASTKAPGVPRIVVPGNGNAYGINKNPHVLAQCVEPGVGYIFYDDEAVIAYEPFPDNPSIMYRAIELTVEIHNRDNPDNAWGYINVPPVASPPPDTSNDPVLGLWEVALVLDDGTIVEFYKAEFDWEWDMWKSRTMRLQLELYNRDNDPDAHIVWGPDA